MRVVLVVMDRRKGSLYVRARKVGAWGQQGEEGRVACSADRDLLGSREPTGGACGRAIKSAVGRGWQNVPTGDFPLLRSRRFSVERSCGVSSLLCSTRRCCTAVRYAHLLAPDDGRQCLLSSRQSRWNRINIRAATAFPPAAPYSKRFPDDLHCLTNLLSRPVSPQAPTTPRGE